MQLKYFSILAVMVFCFSTNAYECKTKEFRKKIPESNKEAFKIFRQEDRQVLVEGMLFEITSAILTKENARKGQSFLSYLEGTEVNANQRSFFKLLQASSDITTSKPKALHLNEVCEIMDKVNTLK